jgi:hypothetical protein
MRTFFYRGRFIFIPIAIAAFVALTGFVVMSLWNYLIPVIFHLGMITFWQAVGIFVLCKILFGFGGKGRGMRGGAPWMRNRMEERFKNMTPEDREKFKAKWEQKCGPGRWDHHRDRHRDHPFADYWDKPAEGTEKATE